MRQRSLIFCGSFAHSGFQDMVNGDCTVCACSGCFINVRNQSAPFRVLALQQRFGLNLPVIVRQPDIMRRRVGKVRQLFLGERAQQLGGAAQV